MSKRFQDTLGTGNGVRSEMGHYGAFVGGKLSLIEGPLSREEAAMNI